MVGRLDTKETVLERLAALKPMVNVLLLSI